MTEIIFFTLFDFKVIYVVSGENKSQSHLQMLKYSVEYLYTNRLGPIVVWDNDLIQCVASRPAGSQLFTRLLSSQGISNVYNLFFLFLLI